MLLDVQKTLPTMPRLSASRVAAAFDMDPYRSPIELSLELQGELPQKPEPDYRDVNHPLRRGKLLERAIVEAGRLQLERWLLENGQPAAVPVDALTFCTAPTREDELELLHPDIPWSAHPDVIYVDALSRWWIADAKSSAIWFHAMQTDAGKVWSVRRKFDRSGDVPPSVYSQLHVIWDIVRAARPALEEVFANFSELMPVMLVPLLELGNASQPFSLLHVPVDFDFIDYLADGTRSFLEAHASHGSDLPLPSGELSSATLALWASRQPDTGLTQLRPDAAPIWKRYRAILDARPGWLQPDGTFTPKPADAEDALEVTDDGETVTLDVRTWEADKKRVAQDLLALHPRAIVHDGQGSVLFASKIVNRAAQPASSFSHVETRVREHQKALDKKLGVKR
jgi:hypothetical protein